MEERTVKVSFDRAVDWYYSENPTLQKLALSVYTKEELELNFKHISKSVATDCGCIHIPVHKSKKYIALAELEVIAKHFNGNWKKTTDNTGYLLGNYNTNTGPMVDYCNGVGVYQHNTLQYAGVVYFKNQEDAIKAVQILGEKVKNLFD